MMLRPSYNDLIQVVNSGVEEPVVQSRYSIVIATAKRARQLIGGEEATVMERARKPLSVAIDELYQSRVKIINEEPVSEDEGE